MGSCQRTDACKKEKKILYLGKYGEPWGYKYIHYIQYCNTIDYLVYTLLYCTLSDTFTVNIMLPRSTKHHFLNTKSLKENYNEKAHAWCRIQHSPQCFTKTYSPHWLVLQHLANKVEQLPVVLVITGLVTLQGNHISYKSGTVFDSKTQPRQLNGHSK